MPDYGNRCYRGCGGVAVVIEGDSRYCARCWLHGIPADDFLGRVWSIGWTATVAAAQVG